MINDHNNMSRWMLVQGKLYQCIFIWVPFEIAHYLYYLTKKQKFSISISQSSSLVQSIHLWHLADLHHKFIFIHIHHVIDLKVHTHRDIIIRERKLISGQTSLSLPYNVTSTNLYSQNNSLIANLVPLFISNFEFGPL